MVGFGRSGGRGGVEPIKLTPEATNTNLYDNQGKLYQVFPYDSPKILTLICSESCVFEIINEQGEQPVYVKGGTEHPEIEKIELSHSSGYLYCRVVFNPDMDIPFVFHLENLYRPKEIVY